MCGKRSALTISGMIFAAIAALHYVRYSKAWVVVVHDFTVPVEWSMYGSVITGVLALFMFINAIKK